MPTRAAVATPHPLATAAARDILEQGGNAFDAAVGAMTTLCVVLSHQVGLGGYGGNMVAYLARDRRVVAVDFDSRAPLAFKRDLFTNTSDSSLGYKSISTPAIPAGLALILKTYGTRTWKDVTVHAIHHAEAGFAMDETTHRFLTAWLQKTDPDSRRTWFEKGDIPNIGQPWIQKNLANTLGQIALDGVAPFYTGDLARAMIRHIQSHGGILSDRDLAEYQPQLVWPVSISYREHDIYVPHPPAGGITTLQILRTLEAFDIPHMQPWSAEYLDLLAQVIHQCWADRIRYLGDPDFVNIPIDQLLGKRPRDRMNHTANVTILDSEGNLVTMTATQGMVFGSQVVIPGTGLIMNHGMSRFDYENPHHPNFPQPGKRMHHNMVPTLVLRDAQPRFACGLPGGTKIITVTAQLLINFIDFQTNPRECIFAPRMHTEPGEGLGVSSAVPDSVIEQLKQMGHTVTRGQSVGGPPTEIAGNANALAIDANTRVPSVASQASPDAAVVLLPSLPLPK